MQTFMDVMIFIAKLLLIPIVIIYFVWTVITAPFRRTPNFPKK